MTRLVGGKQDQKRTTANCRRDAQKPRSLVTDLKKRRTDQATRKFN